MAVLQRERVLPPTRVGHRVLVVGHRGASAERPENTLSAVRRACEVGADLVEVDVRMTRDGVPVLLHDESLARTTDVRRAFPAGAPWRVADLDLDDVQRVATTTGEPVPTLAEALPLGPLLLDLKQPSAQPGLVETIAELLPNDPDVVVQSVDVPALRHLRALRDDVHVAVLGRPAADRLPALATWAGGVHVHHLRLDRGYVDRLHDLGLRCLTWTVNHPRMVERALRLGVDGVITDRPDVLVRRLHRPREIHR